MKIFLIGFMGSGKSYLGKILAEKLSFSFLDLDNLIENTEGVSVAEIFEKKGETYFRNLETERLHDLEKWENLVVATGGGAPCFNQNMAWLNAHGITVYLKTDPLLLCDRLKSETEKRPLLRGKSEEELLLFIENKISERTPFYTRAHISVEQNCDGETIVFDILKKILDFRTGN